MGIATIAKAGALELLDRNLKIAKTKIRTNYIPFVFKPSRGIIAARISRHLCMREAGFSHYSTLRQ